jgi:hypothetical protein
MPRCVPGSALLLLLTAWAAAQAPTRPDFSGAWTLVKDPDGPDMAGLGDRFTIEQHPTWLTMTRDVMERLPGEQAHLVRDRFTYPFDGTERPEPFCQFAKSSWDGSSFVIVANSVDTFDCLSMVKQTKIILRLEADGRLVVELTATLFQGNRVGTLRGVRVIPGNEPQLLWINRYERIKQ